MLTAKDRAMLYDHRFQFYDVLHQNGRRMGGIAWLPGGFFQAVTERCIYSDAPIVIIERAECARIGSIVADVINRMMGANHDRN